MTKNPDSFLPIPEISFFCPAYNDEKNLPKLIPAVYAFLSSISNKFEILIIEDGSPDRTGEVAEKLAKQYHQVRVIHHSKNLGYGAALRDGFREAKYDYVMYTDGDNQYNVEEFRPYLSRLKEADILSGYAVEKAVTLRRKIQSILFNFFIRILFGINIKDINCSMKIYKKKVLDSMEIKSTSAFIDAEMLIKAKRLGFKIVQFPVTHYKREQGVASGSRADVIIGTVIDALKFRFGLL